MLKDWGVERGRGWSGRVGWKKGGRGRRVLGGEKGKTG